MPQNKEWESFVVKTLHPFLHKRCNGVVPDIHDDVTGSSLPLSASPVHSPVHSPVPFIPHEVHCEAKVEMKPSEAFALDGMSDVDGDMKNEEGWGWDDDD